MVFDRLFTQNRILETAMQATQYRNQTIINNIANVDTPDYKAKYVNFEGALDEAITKTKETGTDQMGSVMKNISVVTKENSTTLDGNSIDVETEMINFYKNSNGSPKKRTKCVILLNVYKHLTIKIKRR